MLAAVMNNHNCEFVCTVCCNEYSQLQHTQICQSRATVTHATFSAADLHDRESPVLLIRASCMAWNKTASERGNEHRLTTSWESTLWIQSINGSLPSVSVYHNKIHSTEIHTRTHIHAHDWLPLNWPVLPCSQANVRFSQSPKQQILPRFPVDGHNLRRT